MDFRRDVFNDAYMICVLIFFIKKANVVGNHLNDLDKFIKAYIVGTDLNDLDKFIKAYICGYSFE